MSESISVITLTHNRVDLLKRAIRVVQNQDYSARIDHLIIVDDCTVTLEYLRSQNLPDNVKWYWLGRNGRNELKPALIARNRNFGVDVARTKWISFLDDDNEFESNHISSLVACAIRSKCRAVHSYMQICCADGRPYLDTRKPWVRNPEESRRLYVELCAKGVYQQGSNIVRDRIDPLDHPDPVRTVDTGEWLLERTLLIEYPFCTEYTNADWSRMVTEDDKLMDALVRNKIPIACTGLPTLKYYLGGYSNTFDK